MEVFSSKRLFDSSIATVIEYNLFACNEQNMGTGPVLQCDSVGACLSGWSVQFRKLVAIRIKDDCVKYDK